MLRVLLKVAVVSLLLATFSLADDKSKSKSSGSGSRSSGSDRGSSRSSSSRESQKPSSTPQQKPAASAPKASSPAPAQKSPAANPAPAPKSSSPKNDPPKSKPESSSRSDDRDSLRNRLQRSQPNRDRDSTPGGKSGAANSTNRNTINPPFSSGNSPANSIRGKTGQAATNREQDAPSASQQRFKQWLEQNQKSLPAPKAPTRGTTSRDKQPTDNPATATAGGEKAGSKKPDAKKDDDHDGKSDRPNLIVNKPAERTTLPDNLKPALVGSAITKSAKDRDHDHVAHRDNDDRPRIAQPSLHRHAGQAHQNHDHDHDHHHHHHHGGYYCGRPSWLIFSLGSFGVINRPVYPFAWSQPVPVVVPGPSVSAFGSTLPPPPQRRADMTPDEFNDLPWPRQRDLLGQALNSLASELSQADNGDVWREHLQLDMIANVLSESDQPPTPEARDRIRGVLDEFDELTRDENYQPITELAGFRALFAGLSVIATEPLDRQHRRVAVAAGNMSRAINDWNTADQWRAYLRLDLLTGEPTSVDIEEQLAAMTALLSKFDRVRIDPSFRIVRDAPHFDATHAALRDYVALLRLEAQPDPPQPN